MKATSEIDAYMATARPGVGLRVDAERLSKEFPSSGKADTSNPQDRVRRWGSANGYEIEFKSEHPACYLIKKS